MHRRVKKEQRIVTRMIHIYCRDVHQNEQLCEECEELLNYTERRLLKCPFMKNKPICSSCDIHCYNTKQQDRIKEVIRTVSPKMIFTNTFDTLWYLFYKFTHKYQKAT